MAHIRQTGASAPAATRWHCVVDNLHVQQAEALVRYVAAAAGLTDDLGGKGQVGILANQQSRAAFLHDPTHPIGCHDTPQHASWRKQIAIWLRIRTRKLLRRGSCTSIQDVQDQLLACSAYDNRTMAKPCKWTYQGKALCA